MTLEAYEIIEKILSITWIILVIYFIYAVGTFDKNENMYGIKICITKVVVPLVIMGLLYIFTPSDYLYKTELLQEKLERMKAYDKAKVELDAYQNK